MKDSYETTATGNAAVAAHCSSGSSYWRRRLLLRRSHGRNALPNVGLANSEQEKTHPNDVICLGLSGCRFGSAGCFSSVCCCEGLASASAAAAAAVACALSCRLRPHPQCCCPRLRRGCDAGGAQRRQELRRELWRWTSELASDVLHCEPLSNLAAWDMAGPGAGRARACQTANDQLIQEAACGETGARHGEVDYHISRTPRWRR